MKVLGWIAAGSLVGGTGGAILGLVLDRNDIDFFDGLPFLVFVAGLLGGATAGMILGLFWATIRLVKPGK
jgi:hypothetical protein